MKKHRRYLSIRSGSNHFQYIAHTLSLLGTPRRFAMCLLKLFAPHHPTCEMYFNQIISLNEYDPVTLGVALRTLYSVFSDLELLRIENSVLKSAQFLRFLGLSWVSENLEDNISCLSLEHLSNEIFP